jgi:hypothetical protein
LVLDIIKIYMDFGSYSTFPSSDVSEKVNQQNSWNLLVISTYLLYLERLQSGADWPGSLAGWPPTGPTCQWPLHTASSCQVHSGGDTYFVTISYFLVIS